MSEEKKPNTAIWVTVIGGIFTVCAAVVGAVSAPIIQDWLSKATATPSQSVAQAVETMIASSRIPPANPTVPGPTASFPIPTVSTEIPAVESPTFTPEPPTVTPTPFYQGPPLIAFVSRSGVNGVIYTMTVDGNDQRPITSFDFDSDTPSWSPDGQWIYFSANRDGGHDIYKMRWDGSNITRLTSDPREEYWPRLSPNGQKIVYGVKFGEDNYQLFTMNPDGSGVQDISNSQMNEEHPSWSPNGQWLVFWYCRGPNSPSDLRCEIYRMNASGTDRRNITNTSFSEIWPEISPDGTTIAFVANIRSYPQLNDTVSNIDIFLSNSDGTNVRRVTTVPSVDTNPSWSPDGSRLLFKSAKDDSSETDIWVISASGRGLFQLTSLPGNESYPAWQPLP